MGWRGIRNRMGEIMNKIIINPTDSKLISIKKFFKADVIRRQELSEAGLWWEEDEIKFQELVEKVKQKIEIERKKLQW